MGSLDTDSLFTNVPLEETINTEMLSLTTKESIILFDMVLYTQADGVAIMGSSLEPSLANALLCHNETKWLNDCPDKFKPVFYKRYVDDIFVLF